LKRGAIPSIGGLTAFVAAAQHGSFTRAARELGLTQGAVSRQIQELENHLGIRLFERIRQRVILTDAGSVYLGSVKKALEELADATQKMASFSSSTPLNLVVLPTFATHWLAPRLPVFQKRNPEISIHLMTRQPPMDASDMSFDAAVYFETNDWPGTVAYPILDAEVFPVCSPKLNARNAIKTPADIARHRLLHETARPTRWAEWMAEAGVETNNALSGHTYQNFAMIAQAAVAGVGIALLPRYAVEQELADRRLEIVAGDFVRVKISYYLIVPETRVSSGAVQTFAAWLLAEAAAWASHGDAGRAGRPAALASTG